MRGIILAGGAGTRLHPATVAVSKQLLPVAAKPMIYYPLSVLMLAGIRDVLVVGRPDDLPRFRQLFGDGSDLGISVDYAPQDQPRGIAEALVIGADHIGHEPVMLILGDNIFHGHDFSGLLAGATTDVQGCVLFGYPVPDPERYGVGVTGDDGRLVSIEEKPRRPRSNRAITGLYIYANDVVDVAKNIRPSGRGELEITEVNQHYVERGTAHLVDLGRGFAWLDTGTPDALLQANQYVHALEERQGIRIACLEEIALRKGYIDRDQCRRLGERHAGSPYGAYVLGLSSAVAYEGSNR